jgi:hypothetical protein
LLFSPSPRLSLHPAPSAACPFQLLVHYPACLFFAGLCWFIPGVDVGILCAVYLLTCWSASPKQFWSQLLAAWEPSCFLNLKWCGEALYGLSVWGVGVLLLLGGFFSAKCGSGISAKFFIYGAQDVYLLFLVAILDPSYIWLFHIYFIQCSLRLLNL